MKKMVVLFMSLLLSSFQTKTTLKGTWKFVGGIYNGKKESQPTVKLSQLKKAINPKNTKPGFIP